MKQFNIKIINIDSIFCDNMLFKYENQWTDSPECKICSQSFNKLKAIFKHHWFFYIYYNNFNKITMIFIIVEFVVNVIVETVPLRK